jgi:hypothetical protein
VAPAARLDVARSLAHALGAEIRLEAAAGGGSRRTLTIPLDPATAG